LGLSYHRFVPTSPFGDPGTHQAARPRRWSWLLIHNFSIYYREASTSRVLLHYSSTPSQVLQTGKVSRNSPTRKDLGGNRLVPYTRASQLPRVQAANFSAVCPGRRPGPISLGTEVLISSFQTGAGLRQPGTSPPLP